eukprot:13050170-Alexandrium_andersonii.AAC.1
MSRMSRFSCFGLSNHTRTAALDTHAQLSFDARIQNAHNPYAQMQITELHKCTDAHLQHRCIHRQVQACTCG